MKDKLRFYTTDSNHYWKQCKYCGAFCQLIINGLPTNRTMSHHGDCAVLRTEILEKENSDLKRALETYLVSQSVPVNKEI